MDCGKTASLFSLGAERAPRSRATGSGTGADRRRLVSRPGQFPSGIPVHAVLGVRDGRTQWYTAGACGFQSDDFSELFFFRVVLRVIRRSCCIPRFVGSVWSPPYKDRYEHYATT